MGAVAVKDGSHVLGSVLSRGPGICFHGAWVGIDGVDSPTFPSQSGSYRDCSAAAAEIEEFHPGLDLHLIDEHARSSVQPPVAEDARAGAEVDKPLAVTERKLAGEIFQLAELLDFCSQI